MLSKQIAMAMGMIMNPTCKTRYIHLLRKDGHIFLYINNIMTRIS